MCNSNWPCFKDSFLWLHLITGRSFLFTELFPNFHNYLAHSATQKIMQDYINNVFFSFFKLLSCAIYMRLVLRMFYTGKQEQSQVH